MDQNLSGCGVRTLVEGRVCRIDACGCGTLHLTVGMLTLRLKRAAARALAESLREALDELALDEPLGDVRPTLC